MKKYLLSLATMVLLLASGSLRAQDPSPEDQQPPQDPPTAQVGQTGQQDPQAQDSQTTPEPQPGVARVSFVHGDVSSQRGETGDWVAVTLNTPIMRGDHLATGKKSHAEFQLDHANILRLSNEATAKIVSLTRTSIQIQVGQGLVTYSVLKGSEADVEIDTPNVAIHLQAGEGSYRILVNNEAQTEVVVRNGSAEISTSQGSTNVSKGQEVTIAGTDNPQYKVAQASGKDDWDKWNNDRDRLIANADSWNHTDRNYTGSQDLDAYGRWTTVPEYGSVWVPTVSAGWAPYRAGRWVWYPYYGWTWVSYEPWGWAPYHYGRWFVYGGGWAWWPGPARIYPVWAPAYVSFFGFGRGGGFSFGVGFGFGNVGWLPIGPCDSFYPWYGRYGSRVTVVNVYNSHNGRFNGAVRPIQPLARNFSHPYSNMSQAFTNPRVRSGFSSMPGNQFGHGAVPSSQRGIDSAGFRQASMMTGGLPAKATHDSMRPTDRQVNTRDLPRSATTSQHFFTRSQAPAARASFHGQATQTQRSVNTDTPRNSNPGGFRTNGQTPRGGNMQGTQGGNTTQTRSGMVPNRSEGATQTMRQSTTDVPRTAPVTSQTQTQPGWQTFSGGNTSRGRIESRGPGANPGMRSGAPIGNTRQQQIGLPPVSRQPQAGPGGSQSGWQHYNPSEHPSQPGSTMRQSQSPMQRGSSASGRPPLELRQPIVSPRSSSPSGGSRGSYGAGPSGGRGSYSAPAPSRAPAPSPSHSSGGGSGSHSSGSSHGRNGGGHPHQ
jgi:hypothetical protein